MNSSELLEEFQSLGGVVSNIEIRDGEQGRGLFVIDPSQEAKIFVPDRLLVPSGFVELDGDGRFRLSENYKVGTKQKQFIEKYQQALSWGRANQEIFLQQDQLSSLPEQIKSLLGKMGWTEKDFVAPTPATCLDKFKQSRRLHYKGKFVLMPILELANHDASFKSFEIKQGAGISGRFTDQVLVNYATGLDPVGMFRTYGFSEVTEQVMSCPMELGNPAFGKIIISRAPGEAIMSGGARVPKMRRDGNQYHLSYLPIGDIQEPARPKIIFGQIMRSIGLMPNVIDLLFSRIVENNFKLYQETLAELNSIQGGLSADLRKMLQQQMYPIRS